MWFSEGNKTDGVMNRELGKVGYFRLFKGNGTNKERGKGKKKERKKKLGRVELRKRGKVKGSGGGEEDRKDE